MAAGNSNNNDFVQEPEISEPVSLAEDEPEPEGETMDSRVLWQWITLFSFCILLIIVGNILVIVVLLRNKATRSKQPNMFLLSLLVARTSVAIFVIPARIMGLFSNEYLGSVLCKLCHFAGQGSAVTSVLSTSAVALAKYREVKKPANVKPRTSLIQIAVMWFLGYAWGIRALILNDLILMEFSNGYLWACTTNPDFEMTNSIFIIVDIVLLFLVPFCIVMVCYVGVIKHLNDLIKKQMSVDKKTRVAHINSIRMLIVVIILFMVCHSLPYIFKLYIFFQDIEVQMSDFAEVERWVYWISYTNPWLNLFAYILFRDDIRTGLYMLCGRKQNKIHDSTAIILSSHEA